MKYKGINFPFYGLNTVPSVRFTLSEIFFTIQNIEYIVDDKNIPGEYLNRLLRLKVRNNCITFNYTAKSLQELIYTKIPFGIDNTGKLFDLSKKEIVKFKCSKIDKTRNNLLWVKGISYPFEFKYDVLQNINEFIFAYLVKIENTWYIYDFSYTYNDKKRIKI